ncbi:hypothetical protein SAMN04488136_10411 [Vibrio xiamenensis]|uniref:Uncharacterized protein n=1 Tax=Vibrio xiamenensis TaxID=861298 RepID=A0A1G7WW14_9VIBR|nr:hypothetical protein [Vibrio xiamenensis]SDG76132.1 hypothetical protein SAMN04488136_102207 [Vibrio xiamenensis]SDG87384.1 hypothetical protein SAMN04488136_10411 [Vibrio xiamenensis]
MKSNENNTINFEFSVEGYEIVASVSKASGQEITTINGDIISSKRNLYRNSTHEFQLDGKRFKVNLQVQSIIKGIYVCTLTIDDTVIETLQYNYEKPEGFHRRILALLFMFCGALLINHKIALAIYIAVLFLVTGFLKNREMKKKNSRN